MDFVDLSITDGIASQTEKRKGAIAGGCMLGRRCGIASTTPKPPQSANSVARSTDWVPQTEA
jgi:hypothetical protein